MKESNDKGKATIVGNVADITDRKEAEEARRLFISLEDSVEILKDYEDKMMS